MARPFLAVLGEACISALVGLSSRVVLRVIDHCIEDKLVHSATMLKAATLTKLIVERTCVLSSPSHSIRGVNHQILQCYYFSDSSSWNKKQIDRIESKFKDKTEDKINNDEGQRRTDD